MREFWCSAVILSSGTEKDLKLTKLRGRKIKCELE
jgi:hypothetical protein